MAATRAPASLEFIEESHTYLIDGAKVPGVTSVINAFLPGWQADQWHLDRGRAIHHGCHLLDEGCLLDEETVSPEIAGHIEAWKSFRAQWVAEVVASEKQLWHTSLRYAGTIDRVFRFNGRLVICDIKSSIAPQARLQLAAYRRMWHDNGGEHISRAVAVELNATGKFTTLWVDSEAELRRDEQTFLGCLNAWYFAKAHGIKLKGEAA